MSIAVPSFDTYRSLLEEAGDSQHFQSGITYLKRSDSDIRDTNMPKDSESVLPSLTTIVARLICTLPLPSRSPRNICLKIEGLDGSNNLAFFSPIANRQVHRKYRLFRHLSDLRFPPRRTPLVACYSLIIKLGRCH